MVMPTVYDYGLTISGFVVISCSFGYRCLVVGQHESIHSHYSKLWKMEQHRYPKFTSEITSYT